MIVFMITWSLIMLTSMLDMKQYVTNHTNRQIHDDSIPFMTKFNNAPQCTPLTPQEIQYTLVTHSSEDRLWMMEHHCKRWSYTNSISIAVFTNQEVDDIYSKLTTLGCHREHLTVQTVRYQSSIDKHHVSKSNLRHASTDSDSNFFEGSIQDYPVNKLRNMALSIVTTSHVLLLDIDFLGSTDLFPTLHRKDVKETLSKDDKMAIVVPAFQVYHACALNEECDEANISRMPYTKTELKKLVKKGSATMFDPTNRGGHGTTNYVSWFGGSDQGLIDIPCIKSKRYEPYIVLRFCDVMPPFQERFNGYGKNKLSWSLQMHRVGYRFKQLDEGFITHYPHDDSKARKKWNLRPDNLQQYMKANELPSDSVDWSNYKRGQVDALYVEFQNWLNLEVADDARTPMCTKYNNDNNLWVTKRG